MEFPFYLLLIIGHLGIFDVLYFHQYKCKLTTRPESRTEVIIHTMRHLIYGIQFFYIANFRATGSFVWAIVGLLIIDFLIAMSDVWVEKESRHSQGGLPRGEYLMHILLSFLVGNYFVLLFQQLTIDHQSVTNFLLASPQVPQILIYYMTLMGTGAFLYFIHDSYYLITNKNNQVISLNEN